jgi:hypothetical protein
VGFDGRVRERTYNQPKRQRHTQSANPANDNRMTEHQQPSRTYVHVLIIPHGLNASSRAQHPRRRGLAALSGVRGLSAAGDDDPVGERYLYPLLVERLLQALPQLAHHVPLPDRLRIAQDLDLDA